MMIAVWSGSGAMLRVNACEAVVVTVPVSLLVVQFVFVVPPVVEVVQVSVVVVTIEPVIQDVVFVVEVGVVVVDVEQFVPVDVLDEVVPRIGASTIIVGCIARPVAKSTRAITPGLDELAAVVKYPV